MAVPLRIIRLTMEIDKGDYRAYEQLKVLARTDPDARRVLTTVKAPQKPTAKPAVKVAPQPKQDTPKQTAEKAKSGDTTSIAILRKKAEYQDTAAQSALGLALIRSNPEEARKWLISSSRVPESMEALKKMAAGGDEKAKEWLDSQKKDDKPKPRGIVLQNRPVVDDLGYYKPPSKHSNPKIGEVYRLNDAKLNTGEKNTMVVIKEKKGDFVTVWTVTREPGKRKAVQLIEPSLAGFASPRVYVLVDKDRVMKKDALAEYRGSLGPSDVKQFRLSA